MTINNMSNRRLIQDIIPPKGYRTTQFAREKNSAEDLGKKKISIATKLFATGFILAVLVSAFSFTPTGRMYAQVFAALTQGNYQLKIFIRDSITIEQTVNDWLTYQENITVDQIMASSYGGDFAVIVRYHSGNTGKVSTRIKILNSNSLAVTSEDNFLTNEARAQEFISNLSSKHTIRSADIFSGSGPWDIFIVYDDEQSTTQASIPTTDSSIDSVVAEDAIFTPADSNSAFEEQAEQDTASTSPETTTSPEPTPDTNIINSEVVEVVPDNDPAPDDMSALIQLR